MISSLTSELQPLLRISLSETVRHLLGQEIKNFTSVNNLETLKQRALSSLINTGQVVTVH